MKQLVELPPNVNEYIESLQKSTDAISLKRQLTRVWIFLGTIFDDSKVSCRGLVHIYLILATFMY